MARGARGRRRGALRPDYPRAAGDRGAPGAARGGPQAGARRARPERREGRRRRDQAGGGDEAALWAGDLFRMLTRYAERRGYKWEALGSSERRRRRFKDVCRQGDGAYSVFRFEGGTHRVQRVPRPSRRGGSTPPPRPSRSCPRRRRSTSRSTRTTSRSTSTARPGRAASREHDRLGGAHHARPTGIVVAMQDEEVQLEQAEGDAGAPRAPARGGAPAPAGGALGAAALADRERRPARRRSAPTTSRRTGSPTTASSSRSTGSTPSSTATWTSSPRR